jgi:hypothetical protein
VTPAKREAMVSADLHLLKLRAGIRKLHILLSLQLPGTEERRARPAAGNCNDTAVRYNGSDRLN